MTTNTTEYRIYLVCTKIIFGHALYEISCQMIQQALGALVYTISLSLSLSLSLNVYPFNLYTIQPAVFVLFFGLKKIQRFLYDKLIVFLNIKDNFLKKVLQ